MKRNPKVRRTYAPSHAQQQKQIKRSLYRDRVEKLRPYFGDLFRPKADGSYDLRKSPDTWSPKDKARVTKYWRVIAPQIVQAHKPRYYRRDDHLRAAVAHTQQEDFLPGQRAALFAVEEGETLKVKVRGNKVKVVRQGVGVEKAYFDPQLMIRDPEAAVIDVLERLPDGALRYKIMVGPHESRGTWRAEDIAQGVMYLVSKYDDESEYDPSDTHSRYYTNWLFGISAYYSERGSKLDKWMKQDRSRRDAEIAANRATWVERRREANETLKAKKKPKRKRKVVR